VFDANLKGVTDKLKLLVRFHSRSGGIGNGTNIIAGTYECRVIRGPSAEGGMMIRVYNPMLRKRPTKPSMDVSELDVGYRCVTFEGRNKTHIPQ